MLSKDSTPERCHSEVKPLSLKMLFIVCIAVFNGPTSSLGMVFRSLSKLDLLGSPGKALLKTSYAEPWHLLYK